MKDFAKYKKHFHDALLEDCKQFGILELCRTGVTALERGKTAYSFE